MSDFLKKFKSVFIVEEEGGQNPSPEANTTTNTQVPTNTDRKSSKTDGNRTYLTGERAQTTFSLNREPITRY